MDRLVKPEVKEIEMSFKNDQKCSVVFRVTNLMHTMAVAVSLTTTNPKAFSIPQPFIIIPPLSSLPCTLLSQPSDRPPLRFPLDAVTVRSAMLPTGKAQPEDLRRLFSVPGRHVFRDAVVPISLVGPQVAQFLVENCRREKIASEMSSFLPRALSGCTDSQIAGLLAMAVRSDSAELVSAMVNAGASDIGKDSGEKSLVSVAVERGNMEIVKVLIASGFEIDDKSLFHVATRANRADLIEFLCKSFAHMDVNSKDSENCTPIHVAARLGHVEAVRSLLSLGADAEIADGRGWTPLHHAAAEGHLAAAEILLEHGGGNKHAVDREGRTAFGLAAENGHAELFPALRLNDALQRAARAGDAGAVRSCLAEGAAVDGRDQWGWTPLHRAALKGRLECARLLLSSGAQVDATDHAGYTPLRCAVEAGHPSLAALLVAHGARVGTSGVKKKVARGFSSCESGRVNSKPGC